MYGTSLHVAPLQPPVPSYPPPLPQHLQPSLQPSTPLHPPSTPFNPELLPLLNPYPAGLQPLHPLLPLLLIPETLDSRLELRVELLVSPLLLVVSSSPCRAECLKRADYIHGLVGY